MNEGVKRIEINIAIQGSIFVWLEIVVSDDQRVQCFHFIPWHNIRQITVLLVVLSEIRLDVVFLRNFTSQLPRVE
jgi:hypothetical protein